MKIQNPGRELPDARTLGKLARSPLSGEERWRGQADLPAEDETEREHEIGNVSSCFGELHTCNDGSSKCRGEEEEDLRV